VPPGAVTSCCREGHWYTIRICVSSGGCLLRPSDRRGLKADSRVQTVGARVGIVKCTGVNRILGGLLALAVLCTLVTADTQGPAPQFAVKTLSGETFTNSSLSGRVTLLQFWATWCPHCRRDQAAVDNMERSYADKGLIVLAVDVDESEATVRKYLEANPRSCRIVLNDGANLAARFGVHGFPYYVLIDGNGNIAGTQNGAGGEASLQRLLSRAGLSPHSDTLDAGNHYSGASPRIGKSTVITVPGTRSTPPSKPLPKTIFVFADGSRFETDHYMLDATSLHVVVDGQPRTIPFTKLDLKATLAVNHNRGVDLNIPKNQSEIFLTF